MSCFKIPKTLGKILLLSARHLVSRHNHILPKWHQLNHKEQHHLLQNPPKLTLTMRACMPISIGRKSLLQRLIVMLTICRHHTAFDAATHMTPVCPLSGKYQLWMLCFVLCKSLSRCALLSKSVCPFVDYNHSRGPVLDDFVIYNHPRGPVLDDFLYKAPYVSVVSRRVL